MTDAEKLKVAMRALKKVSNANGKHYRDLYDEGLWWRAMEIADSAIRRIK